MITPPIILLSTIFEHMCLTNFSDNSKPHLKKLKLMVSKILVFYKNTELLPYCDFYDLSPGNNYPTKYITIVLIRITISNQLGWEEVAK